MSQGPALLLGLTGIVGLVLLFVAWRLARWARRRDDLRSLLAVMSGFALAAFLLIATGSGFRHFGGHYGGHDGYPLTYRCSAWWAEISSAHGLVDGGGGPSRYCMHAAKSAIGTSLTEAAIAGVLVGVAAAGIVHARRRRGERQLGELTHATA